MSITYEDQVVKVVQDSYAWRFSNWYKNIIGERLEVIKYEQSNAAYLVAYKGIYRYIDENDVEVIRGLN